MSRKHFSILFIITVIVAVAVFLVPRPTGRDASEKATAYLPELAAVVNEVSTIRITSEGGTDVVTLERSDDGWVVEEFHGYPADWGALRPILADLSQAVVVEEKTSNPDYYDRLGVEDPAVEGAQGKLIEFPGNDAVPAIIVGNSAQGREGQYLRRQGEAGSVLVDRDIRLPVNGSGWLDRNIVDVSEDDVVYARIEHADGEVIEIQRGSTDVTDFALSGIPEGRTTRSAYTINQIASALSALQLDGVAPADEVDWDGAIALQLRTEDGLEVTARAAEDEEHHWLRLEASGTEAAEEINQRVAGWAYQIPLYKYDSMNKHMEDLLAEVEDEGSE